MKILVSVCIPTYNGAKYLRECLDSVLSQTFTEFEVLIVDDRSSDNTVDIAQEYAIRDPRIKVIVNDHNLGLVGNWNRCVELAQGEWIKFVFQDDLIAQNCLEKMIQAGRPDSFIIACRRTFLFSPNTPEIAKNNYLNLPSLENFFPQTKEISSQEFCLAVLNCLTPNFVGETNFIGEPIAVMLHRNVFQKFGLFNFQLIQICDLEFWTRVAVNTGLIYVSEPLATFRVHEESASSTNNHTVRHYRSFVLDSLILLHDFTFHPVYEPLRAVALSQNSSFNLRDLLIKKARKGLLMAKLADNYWVKSCPEILVTRWQPNEIFIISNNTDPQLVKKNQLTKSKLIYLTEWNRITKIYTKLEELSKRSLWDEVNTNIVLLLKVMRVHFNKYLHNQRKA